MPARDTAPIGAPCWIDLMTSDAERSVEFYRRLLGWTAEEPAEELGGYRNFRKDGVRVAGCMPAEPGSGVPDVWSVYLATDDARKTLEAVTANGGQVHVDAMPVGDLGTMAYVGDPTGAAVGVWQPGAHPGFTVVAEPGAPAWFELHTRDYERAVAFYRQVFGWDTHVASDTPELRYTTLGKDDDAEAGIMDASGSLPEGVPAHWSVYVAVADTDATMAQAVELGGSVVHEPEDSPYGRIGALADPTGARFKVVAPGGPAPAEG